jgi:hypothetical protein
MLRTGAGSCIGKNQDTRMGRGIIVFATKLERQHELSIGDVQ